MNKVVIWAVIIVVILGLFFYFNSKDTPDLAPKQTTQNTDESSPNVEDIDNNLFSINAANLTINFSRAGTVPPYFCQYFALGGGGGGCRPSIPCSCTDSDNGNVPCVFGVVNWTVNQTTNTYRDSCRDNMTLDEYHCGFNGTTILNTVYRCTNGCSNGACI